MATVRDVMDPEPATVREETPIEDVVRLLGVQNTPGLPVVNEGGRCVGIITEADLVLTDEEGDLHLPHYLQVFGGLVFLEPLRRFEDRLRKVFAATAKDLMTSDPDIVSPDADVHEAARVIADSGHNRLPVVEHGRLVGVVTRADVLGALVAERG
ncbi:MAG TPA: CBS domain-containing protein [Thermoleophilaceae bacterium]|nr:CBS domain-containing protein [Thermoleophilaceae bacterium]